MILLLFLMIGFVSCDDDSPIPVYESQEGWRRYTTGGHHHSILPNNNNNNVSTLHDAYAIWIVDTLVKIQINDRYVSYINPPEYTVSIFGSKTETDCCSNGIIWSPYDNSYFCELKPTCLLHEGNQTLLVYVHDHYVEDDDDDDDSSSSSEEQQQEDHWTYLTPFDNKSEDIPLAPLAKYDYCDDKHIDIPSTHGRLDNDSTTTTIVELIDRDIQHFFRENSTYAIHGIQQFLGLLITDFVLSSSSENISIVYVSQKTGKPCCAILDDENYCALDVNRCIGHSMNQKETISVYAYDRRNDRFGSIERNGTILPAILVDTTQMFMPSCHLSYTAGMGYHHHHRRSNGIMTITTTTTTSSLIFKILLSLCIVKYI